MGGLIKHKAILLINFLIFGLIFEILTFYNLGLKPSYLILDILIFLIFGSIIFLFKSNKLAFIYLLVLITLLDVLYVTNVTMMKVFYDIFSFDKIFLINLVDDVFDWQFIPISDLVIGIIIFIIYLVTNIIYIKGTKHVKLNFSFIKRLQMFLVSFFTLILFFTTGVNVVSKNIYINGKQFSDELYITSLKKSAFQHYGMLTFYYKEIETFLGEEPRKIEVPPYEQRQTDYYGLLRDKNIITIMIESGQEMAINEYLTPNLYRLREEGLYFAENYSINKTNVSEHIGIAGNYPTINYSFLTDEYNLPFTLPHILNDKYVTSYFHDNNGEFYYRDILLRQLGFENIYLHDELFPEPLPNWNGKWSWTGNYTLDSWAVERIIPYMIKEDELFYSFWTTLSMHGPYNDNDLSNRDTFERLGYFSKIEEMENLGLWSNPLEGDETGEFQFKYYQAAMMDLDVAVKKILDALTEKDLLDDTIIILYGDHQAYYHDLHLRKSNLTATESYRVDLLYDTILYMWNPTLNEVFQDNRVITTFTSPYIIVPTLLDLLGEEYDANWYLSLSVFDNDYLPILYSHQQNALMNHRLYSIDGETLIYKAEDVTEAEIETFLKYCLTILERQNEINKLYKIK